MTSIAIGLDKKQRDAIAESLNALLADTAVLYQKTHAYHWNITGPQFPALHTLFETQYREMWAALDEIAERIRALGAFAPASGAAFVKLAEIKSADESPPSANDMVASLLADHETLIRRARIALEAASDAGDAASEDLLTARISIHEKTAWMLRATIG